VVLGQQPKDISVNSETNMIYIDHGIRTISVMNGTTNTVVNNIEIPEYPGSLASNPQTSMLYVLNLLNDTVSVINESESEVVAKISMIHRPMRLAVNPETNVVYVSNTGDNRVYFINGTSNTVAKTIIGNYTDRTGEHPIAVDTTTNLVYIGHTNSISVIDGYSNKALSRIFVSKQPYELAVNPETNLVYVSDWNNGRIHVINGNKGTILRTAIDTQQQDQSSSIGAGIKVGYSPVDIAAYAINNEIYVINRYSNVISIIDGETDKVVRRVNVNGTPYRIAVNPLTNTV
jgi:YVTN family beta-propeller protein